MQLISFECLFKFDGVLYVIFTLNRKKDDVCTIEVQNNQTDMSVEY